MFYTFDYLGRLFLFDKNYLPAVAGNIRKARKKWDNFYRMKVCGVGDAKTSGVFYVAMVQYVLVLG